MQNEHGMASDDGQNRVSALGRALPSLGMFKRMGPDCNKSEEITDQRATNAENFDRGECKWLPRHNHSGQSEKAEELPAEACGWVQNRAVTLTWIIRIQPVVWTRLVAPPSVGTFYLSGRASIFRRDKVKIYWQYNSCIKCCEWLGPWVRIRY